MADLEEKEKSNRYPMKTYKQAKSTLSRLTRDLLHGRIDIQKYRAACYGLSVLCSLFKIETPEHKDIDISIGRPDWVFEETKEERKNRLTGLLKKSLPFYESYLEFAKKRGQEIQESECTTDEIDSLEHRLDFEKQSAFVTVGAEKRNGEITDETDVVPSNYKRGIGVQRST